jgi:hypothetical protein
VTATLDVLPRPEAGNRVIAFGSQDERDDIGRLLMPGEDFPWLPTRTRFEAGVLIQAGLEADQGACHQPVQLVPGGCDLRCDRRAQDIGDRGEQVGVDDLVLVGGYAERGVRVCNPGEDRPWVLSRVIHHHRRESRDRTSQRLLLRAGGLVASIEQVREQRRVVGEQLAVEDGRNFWDHRAYRGQSLAHDGQRGR